MSFASVCGHGGWEAEAAAVVEGETMRMAEGDCVTLEDEVGVPEGLGDDDDPPPELEAEDVAVLEGVTFPDVDDGDDVALLVVVGATPNAYENENPQAGADPVTL